MTDLKELKALVRAMHSLGVISLKTKDIELVIAPKQPQVRRKRRNPMAEVPEAPLPSNKGFGGYTDEEVLTWSSSPVVNDTETEA